MQARKLTDVKLTPTTFSAKNIWCNVNETTFMSIVW